MPRNISKARRPKWTGQPGEAAIVVSRGEPRRDDRQMEELVREQVFAYLDEHVPDRQVDQLVRYAAVHLIVKGYVWPRNGAPRGEGVMLTREHLLAFVDTAQERMTRAQAAVDAARADLARRDEPPVHGS